MYYLVLAKGHSLQKKVQFEAKDRVPVGMLTSQKYFLELVLGASGICKRGWSLNLIVIMEYLGHKFFV